MQQFTPKTVGSGFEFTPILKPLEPFKNQLVVATNFTRSHPGSQVGDHAVSAAGFLTGVWPKRTEAEDVLANTTIDQIIAQKIGQDTPLPSLELATEDFTGYVGACSPGFSCSYMKHDLLAHSDKRRCPWKQIRVRRLKEFSVRRDRRPSAWSAFTSSRVC